MVNPLTILKMLHCNSIRDKKVSVKEEDKEGTSRDGNTSDYHVKLETDLCRVCLREGIIPIYGDLTNEDVSDALTTFGAIEMSVDDSFPKNLCQPCHALLQGAILFRKTAQQSDEILRKPTHFVPELETDVFDGDTDNESETIKFEALTKIEKETELELSQNDTHARRKVRLKKVKLKNQASDEEQKVDTMPVMTCRRCDIKFNSFQEYNDHRHSAEHENKRIICPVCKNSYGARYIRRHMLLHKAESSFMCDICGKGFIMQASFYRHRLTHFNDLPFKCTLCPYRGRFSESLKMHMRKHTGEKPYQCERCPSRFISKSNLNKHMFTHKEKYDFRCETCGRGFYTKRALDLHFKADHSGIRDHICRFCDKAFGYRKHMMKHELKVHKRQKLHSGRMPIYLKIEKMKQGSNVALEA